MSEFDGLFDDAPKKAPAKAKHASEPESASPSVSENTVEEESPESKSARIRTSRQVSKPFSDLFIDDDGSPEKTSIDPKLLLTTGAGVLGGGLYGALKKPAPSENSLAARLIERYYNLPSGALTTFESHLPTPANEASLAAARAIAPRPGPVTPAQVSSPLDTVAYPEGLSPEQTARIVQGGNSDTRATTGRARQTGYNIQTAQEAAIRDLMGSGMTGLDERAYLANMPGLTATPTGVVTMRSPAVPTAGPRAQGPDVWRRPRAIGPAPWSTFGQVTPLDRMDAAATAANAPVGNAGDIRPGAERPTPIPAAPIPTQQNQPTDEQVAARIRAASARGHALQRGSNAVVRGLFGAPLAAQAYNMATQEEPTDWSQWLSLAGGALGALGPLTSKVPGIASRVPIVGPLAALAQVPYAVKHRDEIARGMTWADVINPAMLTGSEMSEQLPLFHVDGK